jgi:hypothetical protein
MKNIALSLLAVIGLSSCAALEGYTPMLSFGFEVGGSKITVGVAPIPTIQKTQPKPVELPAIEVVPSK